jgi:hypothetical protein
MSSKINGLAYNKKLSILTIHFLLNSQIKTLVKSIAYSLCPLITIIGHWVGFGSGKILSGRGFAKISTSGGMGTYKQLRINSPFNIAQLGFSHA